jgi:hypothetical protein
MLGRPRRALARDARRAGYRPESASRTAVGVPVAGPASARGGAGTFVVSELGSSKRDLLGWRAAVTAATVPLEGAASTCGGAGTFVVNDSPARARACGRQCLRDGGRRTCGGAGVEARRRRGAARNRRCLVARASAITSMTTAVATTTAPSPASTSPRCLRRVETHGALAVDESGSHLCVETGRP